MSAAEGFLYIVGIGPGDHEYITGRAEAVLRSVDCIVGYDGYVELVRAWLPGAKFVASQITHEIERAQEAVQRSLAGQRVALIGSGDAGVYGLAGLALQLIAQQQLKKLVVEVVPGVTAATAAAALLGAPLGHDFAVISLSDILTPWELISRRLEAAAEAGFITVLYNPASGRRREPIRAAQSIFLRHRDPKTPVGMVTNAYRDGQQVAISTLAEFDPEAAGMLATIVIGNPETFAWCGRLITPRGYQSPA